MAHPFDIDDVIAGNPRIDPEQLERLRNLFRRLREKGVPPKGYDLGSPFGEPGFTVRDDPRTDPRSIRLTPPDRDT